MNIYEWSISISDHRNAVVTLHAIVIIIQARRYFVLT